MAKKKSLKKTFVLDTSVIIFDPNCFYSFEDNNIVIPIAVLEELDNMKKGTNDRNFAAREAIRTIESISEGKSLKQWVGLGEGLGSMRVFADMDTDDAIQIYEVGKNDHRILNTALRMMKTDDNVILVSKDINLRIKAAAMDVLVEDYKFGMVKQHSEEYIGRAVINMQDESYVDELLANGTADTEGMTIERIPNMYYTISCGDKHAFARYDGATSKLVLIKKVNAYGIKPRNSEQAFALDAILNDDIKLVTLEGPAGTGKTLMAVAGALYAKSNYDQIYLTKPIIPVGGKDMVGFLPGDLNSKTGLYMNSFHDNINFIKSQNSGNNKGKSRKVDELFNSEKIVIEVIGYIRGRSLSNIIWIVDEAQNLTNLEIKTIITRSGENTKIVFIGDIGQIDTPYLDKKSNGMVHIIDKFKGHDCYAHVKLEKGERSKLATLAGNIL